MERSKSCTQVVAADADQARKNESAMISRLNAANMGESNALQKVSTLQAQLNPIKTELNERTKQYSELTQKHNKLNETFEK